MTRLQLSPSPLAGVSPVVWDKFARAVGLKVRARRLAEIGEKEPKGFLEEKRVFEKSMNDYDAQLSTGALRRPEGVARAGALAVLHRGGRKALKRWPKVLSDTTKLYQKVNGLF